MILEGGLAELDASNDAAADDINSISIAIGSAAGTDADEDVADDRKNDDDNIDKQYRCC